LIRDSRPVVLHADTLLQENDRLIAVTTSSQEAALRGRILGSTN